MTYRPTRLIAVLISCTVLHGCDAKNKSSGALIGQEKALTAASSEYKRFAAGLVDKFRCRLIEESSLEWVFVCIDLDPTPPPGADSMVTVQKKSGQVTVFPGQ